MAKDPAIIWYWGDWYSGTSLMSRFLKGCYMDLLHAQFNSGPLSLEEIKICLGSDFGQAWPSLQKKFKTENGLFFNERMEVEKNKRKSYTDSRRKNRTKKTYDTTYDKDMTNHVSQHMENENEDENKDEDVKWKGIFKGKGKFSFPLTEIETGATVEFCSITLHRTYTPDRIAELFKAFCIQTETKFYPNRTERISHFRNWIKTQPDDTSKGFDRGSSKRGTSDARIEALGKW